MRATIAASGRHRRRLADPRRPLLGWLAVGWLGFLVLPWYGLEEPLLRFEWLADGWAADRDYAPGLFQGLWHGRPWLLPLAVFLALPVLALRTGAAGPRAARVLLAAGIGGLAWFLLQGFAVGLRGVHPGWLAALLGPYAEVRQFGMGWGALLTAAAFLFLLTQGLAARGVVRGDVFVAGSIGLVVALVAAFILYPALTVLWSALRDNDGNLAPTLFARLGNVLPFAFALLLAALAIAVRRKAG